MAIGTETESNFFTLKSVAFGGISDTYATLKSAGDVVKVITFLNKTNQDLLISCDGGVTDSIILEAGAADKYDFGANSFHETGGISVKHNGVAPTSGSVYCFGVKEG